MRKGWRMELKCEMHREGPSIILTRFTVSLSRSPGKKLLMSRERRESCRRGRPWINIFGVVNKYSYRLPSHDVSVVNRLTSPRITHQVLMRVVLVVEDGDDFPKLCQDIVVTRHVCRQDASDDSLTYLSAKSDKRCAVNKVSKSFGRVHNLE